jgi:hypothetical protein
MHFSEIAFLKFIGIVFFFWLIWLAGAITQESANDNCRCQGQHANP